MKALLIIISLLWIFGGSFLSKNLLCGKRSVDKTNSAAAASVRSGGCDATLSISAGQFNVKSKNNFQFKSGSIELLNPKDISADALNKVKQYLTDNPTTSLVIEGLFSEKETNDTGKDNLGIARALVVKNFLVETYKFNEDQLRTGYSTKNACFGSKTNILGNGAKLSVVSKKK